MLYLYRKEERKMKRTMKFKRWVDVVVKIMACLLFFIVLGVEMKTFVLTLIVKFVGTVLLFFDMMLIDKYGRI
jgi:uncharacterized membrane protein YjjP (DUF1212 family)